MSTRIGDCGAADRNKKPIFDALVDRLAGARAVLEIGAGEGLHARHAAARLPGVVWQASEVPTRLRRLAAALADPAVAAGASRPPAPIALDVRGAWPQARYDAVYGANVTHIMDWAAVRALFAGAAAHLVANGLLCLYGPFLEAGAAAAPGNVEFDAALRARDPAMGLRELGALDAEAAAHGLARAADIAMPAHNRLLIWRAKE